MADVETADASTAGATPGLSAAGWVACVLGAAAAGVSAYLTIVSLREGVMPAGCGAGSGCAQVLTSKWSKALGVVPVSALALGAYVALIAGVVGSAAGGRRGTGPWLTGAAAAAIVGAGAWFVFVQAAVVQAWCAWCMTGHTLGAVASVADVVSVVMTGQRGVVSEAAREDATREARPGAGLTGSMMGGGVVGLAGVALLAAVQATAPSTVAQLALPTGRDFDVVRGGERWVGVLDGQMQVGVASLPHAGPVDAEAVALVMFDYACTHCRRHLATLDAYQAEHPGALVRVAIPVPLNSACNPTWEADWDEPVFEDSCRLAAWSFAVWRVKPEAWPAFDRWLWERDEPASAAAAEAEAARVTGDREAVTRAMAEVFAAGTFAPFAEAWHQFETPLPVTMWPGGRYDAGAYDSAEAVADALEAIDLTGVETEADEDG
ncbi:MAG: vitamin K epoxide reductase family protein [Planctomycetota bacterium]